MSENNTSNTTVKNLELQMNSAALGEEAFEVYPILSLMVNAMPYGQQAICLAMMIYTANTIRTAKLSQADRDTCFETTRELFNRAYKGELPY